MGRILASGSGGDLSLSLHGRLWLTGWLALMRAVTFFNLSPAHRSMLGLSRFVVVLDDIDRSFMHGFCCILLHHHGRDGNGRHVRSHTRRRS